MIITLFSKVAHKRFLVSTFVINAHLSCRKKAVEIEIHINSSTLITLIHIYDLRKSIAQLRWLASIGYIRFILIWIYMRFYSVLYIVILKRNTFVLLFHERYSLRINITWKCLLENGHRIRLKKTRFSTWGLSSIFKWKKKGEEIKEKWSEY